MGSSPFPPSLRTRAKPAVARVAAIAAGVAVGLLDLCQVVASVLRKLAFAPRGSSRAGELEDALELRRDAAFVVLRHRLVDGRRNGRGGTLEAIEPGGVEPEDL